MEITERLEIIVKALDAKRAEDIKVIKISDLTTLTEYFVIANGTSTTQTKALADEVEYQIDTKTNEKPRQVQGAPGGGWVVIDYSDIIVHVFYKEQREFYNLERLWQDGTEVDISGWITEKA